MKITARITVVAIALLLSVQPFDARAGGIRHAWQFAYSALAAGQAASAKDQVAQLLAKGRAAMARGEFAEAEKFIAQAEKMNVKFGVFDFRDTPKKARRDLDKAKAAQGVGLPSGQFDPSKSSATPGSKDPFMAAGINNKPQPPAGTPQSPAGTTRLLPPTASELSPLPSLNRQPPQTGRYGEQTTALPGVPAAAAAAQTAEQPGDNRVQSDSALLAARKSLAVGDTRNANEHVEAAKQLNVNYGFQEDSPSKVEAAIRKYQEVVSRREGRENSEAWRRQYAELLMEQAEALLLWKEIDEAERLAGDASKLSVTYGPFEANPKTLLERIASQRQQAVAAAAPPQRLPSAPRTPSAVAVGADAVTGSKAQALELVKQARAALAQGDVERANALAQQAQQLKVPDSAFGPTEDRPWLVALDVLKAKTRNQNVVTANGTQDQNVGSRYAQQSVYDPNQDATFNRPVTAGDPTQTQLAQNLAGPPTSSRANAPAGQVPQTPATTGPEGTAQNDGLRLYKLGEQALRNRDKNNALRYFREAYGHRNEFDPGTLQRLQDHLQMLSAAPRESLPAGGQTLLDNAAARQQVMARQLSAEVAKQLSEARRIRGRDPLGALESLKKTRENMTTSSLEPATRSQLVRRLDIGINDLERFIEDNRIQIDLDARNREIKDRVQDERWETVEVREKIAELVDEFNSLIDEERYEEAEVIAKRARELAPREQIVQQLWITARALRREAAANALADRKENSVYQTLASVDAAAVPFDDSSPIIYGDSKIWKDLSERRIKNMRENNGRRTERELEIERKLKTPVSLSFENRPLAEVMDHLARLTGINIHLDPRGLSEEGVTSNTPVSIALENEISLRSALNLILEPLHLSYVIKDEVLKITSEQLRDGEVYTVTYNVADLVIPIPNFVPGSDLGLSGKIAEAYGAMGYGSAGGGPGAFPVLASHDGSQATGMMDPNLLAQMGQQPGVVSGPLASPAAGPGGLGGGAQADFDALIELITATIQPNTWDEVGGPGSVREFETNLSLVVSQTQDVHEEIVDLLEQLRRLQDLQVTIEVRFIRLNDNFFERIGVDFDFQIEDGTNNTADALAAADVVSPSVTVGFNQNPDNARGFTSDLDIPFTQDSFTASIPAFGGFDPAQAAMFGFAILSDIEAFFLVSAAQGDQRTNILQAPKVTLFNGQQAFVSDTAQMPFVISVIPVVGDFAAAQQPVIVVLSEGTFMTIQAVVSNDRRYVRLTVVPMFSRIGDVDTFTFEGSTTSTTDTTDIGLDDEGNPTDTSNNTTETRSGTTVQLPTFAFVTVTTTVSVPDGGTVLLGGIKRLTEGRGEFGVPLLSKIPYVNRLFRNVGIGRTAESLMMMVTPRIIIQEEEEERLGITP